MLSENSKVFSKENLDNYLKALAKEYRRLSGKSVPAEIILVGGGAVIANYGFREMTMDIDAIIHAGSSMKDAINIIGDKFNLPRGWINADFIYTPSYTEKLIQYSLYYKTFSNIVTVRTISAQYLIAMKLKAGRQFKNDMSDIAGILLEHSKNNNPLSLNQIKEAFINLYESWEDMPDASKSYIYNIFKSGNIDEIYAAAAENEKHARESLLVFEEHYPGTLNKANVQDILAMLEDNEEN